MTARKALIWNAVLVTGIVLRLLVGRPACLGKDYDGIWGTQQYFQVTVFSIAACMGMIGFAMALPMTIQMFVEKKKGRCQLHPLTPIFVNEYGEARPTSITGRLG